MLLKILQPNIGLLREANNCCFEYYAFQLGNGIYDVRIQPSSVDGSVNTLSILTPSILYG